MVNEMVEKSNGGAFRMVKLLIFVIKETWPNPGVVALMPFCAEVLP